MFLNIYMLSKMIKVVLSAVYLVQLSTGYNTLTTCENAWIPYEGSCYFFQNGQKINNLDAERFCNRYHANLVFVNDVHENNFITSFMNQFGESAYWIGITDELVESNWVSIRDDTPAPFLFWFPGEPESGDHKLNEDCVIAFVDHQYHWDDIGCENFAFPICEKPGANICTSEIIG